MDILSIENLSFTYPGSSERALDGVSLSVASGEFLLLCGSSGCGKTTLLRLIKKELSPHGERSGSVVFDGKSIADLSDRESAQKIGFIFQDPEKQIVTDKVWHELAFGLESLGTDQNVMRRHIGEIAEYFGIDALLDRTTDSLSGGQKQLVCIASVMVMSPKLLILDEPISCLDPIAAHELVSLLTRINRELGVTVIVAEHCLDLLFAAADRVCVLEKGRIISCSAPRTVAAELLESDAKIKAALPSASRIAAGISKIDADTIPLTVREGQRLLAEYPRRSYQTGKYMPSDNKTVEVRDVCFRYEKDGADVLRSLSFSVSDAEIFSVVGGNGTGKSTMLKAISGVEKIYRGKIEIFGKNIRKYAGGELYCNNLAFLPQNIDALFLCDSLHEDLFDICKSMNYSRAESESKIKEIAERFGLEGLLDRHPYDLSGGEMHKAALAKILLAEPRLLLLDEPTSGLDVVAKADLVKLLRDMRQKGRTILIVTHDLEFAASVSDRCALFSDGNIVSVDNVENFFSDNDFYTTDASRISRAVFEHAVTVDRIIGLVRTDETV